MLTEEQNYVLFLLREAFDITPTKWVPTSLVASTVVSIIRRNGILLTVWPLLDSLPQEKAQLQTEYYAAVSQSVNQRREGRQVLEALRLEGMDCIPLKGWVLHDLYPHAAMRQMADVDVLICPYDYRRISDTLARLGFMPAGDSESSWKHDSFRKGVVHIEAHKRLTDDSSFVRDWERGMWNRATRTPDGIWHMSDTDFYVFHIVHMHKDILNGSLGLRRIVDTWLLERSTSAECLSAASAQLEAMGLGRFQERMSHLSRACMGEEPLDHDDELLLRHAFTCGIYGNGVSYKAGRIASMSHGGLAEGKVRSAVAAVFLPYSRMKAQFPELERWPVLLPVCWARRIVRFLRGGNLRKYRSMMDYASVTEDDYQEMREVLVASGCIDG